MIYCFHHKKLYLNDIGFHHKKLYLNDIEFVIVIQNLISSI